MRFRLMKKYSVGVILGLFLLGVAAVDGVCDCPPQGAPNPLPTITLSLAGTLCDNTGTPYAFRYVATDSISSIWCDSFYCDSHICGSHGCNPIVSGGTVINWTDSGGPYIPNSMNSQTITADLFVAPGMTVVFADELGGSYCGIGRYGAASAVQVAPTTVRHVPQGRSCNFRRVNSTVNFGGGGLFDAVPILDIPGNGPPLRVSLYYNSTESRTGTLGNGWQHSFEMSVLRDSGNSITLLEEDGNRVEFQSSGSGLYLPLAYYGRPGTTLQKFAPGTYLLTRKDGTRYDFSSYRLASIRDRNTNTLSLSYSSGRLIAITDGGNRTAVFGYDGSNRLASITDPMGRAWIFGYDGSGRLASIADPSGHTNTYVYDGSNRLVSRTDRGGNLHAYGYDLAGRLTSATDNTGAPITVRYEGSPQSGQGRVSVVGRNGGTLTTVYDYLLDRPLQVTGEDNGVTTNGYDGSGNLLWTTDPAGRTTGYTYDTAGNRLTETDAMGRTTTYTYNGFGQVTTVTDPEGNTTTNVYDGNGNLTSVTDAERAVTTYTYDTQGKMTSSTRPGGATTTYGYDGYGNMTSVTDPAGLTTAFTYELVGNMLTRTDPNGAVTAFAYDNLNRPVRVTDPLGKETAYGYDGLGNRTFVTDANGHATTFAYNERGKPVAVTDPLGHQTIYDYTYGGCSSCGDPGGDLLAAVTDPLDRTTAYTYDLMGRRTSSTDPMGSTSTYGYNLSGDLVSSTDPNGRTTVSYYDALSRLIAQTDPAGGNTWFQYTPAGRLDNVIDGNGNRTRYAYDGTGRVTQTLSPDAGTTSYTYNGDGTLAMRTDGNGTAVEFAYDNAARPTGILFPDPSQNVSFSYDSPQSTYGLGRMTGMTDPSGTTTYHYDPSGRLSQEVRVVFGVTYTTSYAYDNVGNLSSVIYPSGRTVGYAADALDRVRTVTSTQGGIVTTLADFIGYDDAGNLLSLPLGNGLSGMYAYDRANRPETIVFGGALGLSYGYDPAGNIVSWGDNTAAPASPASGSAAYAYAGNRLSGITQDNSVHSYQYDGAGNTTSDGIRTFVYNQNQRLIRVLEGGVTKGEYGYDGKGRRVIKTANGTRVFHSDQYDRLISETDVAGNLIVDYVYLGTTPLAQIRKVGGLEQTYYYHTDHLGTPKAMTDATGTVVWKVQFDPFGNEIGTPVKQVENNLRFPGQYFDAETGLHQNYFRDYDPKTGRYIQADPVGIKNDDYNLYNYAGGNPLLFIDSNGLMVLPPEPSGLPSGWKRDCSHRYSYGERYICQGNTLEFHKGRPEFTKRQHRGYDHYHFNDGDAALKPGAIIPDIPGCTDKTPDDCPIKQKSTLKITIPKLDLKTIILLLPFFIPIFVL